jgi:hypothetical protein
MAVLIDKNNTLPSVGNFLTDSDQVPISFNQYRKFTAQTFTASDTYELDSVKLRLGLGTGDGELKCTIETVDGNGKPSGSSIASKSISGSSVTVSEEWIEFSFANAPTLTSGVKYAIVLEITDEPVPQTKTVNWFYNEAGYSGGGLFWAINILWPNRPSAGEWNDLWPSRDLIFEVYGVVGSDPAPFPTPRPADYEPDQVWDPKGGVGGTGGWTFDLSDLTTLGGGRYNQQLVVLGHKKIYFQEL